MGGGGQVMESDGSTEVTAGQVGLSGSEKTEVCVGNEHQEH